MALSRNKREREGERERGGGVRMLKRGFQLAPTALTVFSLLDGVRMAIPDNSAFFKDLAPDTFSFRCRRDYDELTNT